MMKRYTNEVKKECKKKKKKKDEKMYNFKYVVKNNSENVQFIQVLAN